MNKILQKIIVAFLFVCSYVPLCGADLPKQIGWVSDYANVIGTKSYQEMSGIINELEQKTGAEIAVVTVTNFGNDTIENFSAKLFKEWGIGKKGKDNGVLIIASIEDRRVRIEVGYGLEGVLTDGECGHILDTYVIPYFKENEYDTGLSRGVSAVASVIAKSAGVELSGGNIPAEQNSSGGFSHDAFIFLIVLAMLIIFCRYVFMFLVFAGMSGRGRSFNSRLRNYGGFGGGGFGGFSGGGGFGGGMSGGGGASRGW